MDRSKLEEAAIRFVQAYWAKPEAKERRRDTLHKCARDVWLDLDPDSIEPTYVTRSQQTAWSDFSFCFDRTCVSVEKIRTSGALLAKAAQRSMLCSMLLQESLLLPDSL